MTQSIARLLCDSRAILVVYTGLQSGVDG